MYVNIDIKINIKIIIYIKINIKIIYIVTEVMTTAIPIRGISSDVCTEIKTSLMNSYCLCGCVIN